MNVPMDVQLGKSVTVGFAPDRVEGTERVFRFAARGLVALMGVFLLVTCVSFASDVRSAAGAVGCALGMLGSLGLIWAAFILEMGSKPGSLEFVSGGLVIRAPNDLTSTQQIPLSNVMAVLFGGRGIPEAELRRFRPVESGSALWLGATVNNAAGPPNMAILLNEPLNARCIAWGGDGPPPKPSPALILTVERPDEVAAALRQFRPWHHLVFEAATQFSEPGLKANTRRTGLLIAAVIATPMLLAAGNVMPDLVWVGRLAVALLWAVLAILWSRPTRSATRHD